MSDNAHYSPAWIENLYRLWEESPDQVPATWRAYFEGFALGQADETGSTGLSPEMSVKSSAVQSLIYRYRDIGHLLACTDPLSPCLLEHTQLSLDAFDLTEDDLDTVFHTRRFIRPSATLREIIDVMRDTYCRSIGVEFMHIQDNEERQWLKNRMESCLNRPRFSDETKLQIYRKILEATLFEAFLHKKFLGQKRFSLEGGETIIAVLENLVGKARHEGIRDIVLGMAHRGRLNILANVFQKPPENIFSEFKDNAEFDFVGDGDVKYHKGFSADLKGPDGNQIHLTMAHNPSHLEAVDPVVEGKARGRQENYSPQEANKVLPVLIHGDAAFAGQGIVPETLNLAQLEGYGTRGTLHIILNNQIGFTTVPADSRSTLYATDITKMLMVPIFHIHGEDPEAAIWAASLALEYRQKFGKDAILELICYRKHGHNEGDEPSFTQPLMYEKIRQRPGVFKVYGEKLIAEGVATADELEKIADRIVVGLERALEKVVEPESDIGFHGKWTGLDREYSEPDLETGVAADTITDLAGQMASLPDDFNPHPKIAKLLEKRLDSVRDRDLLDWGTTENLAYATLLNEGHPIRISGQDSRRGTFNHRHATIYDSTTGKPYTPLASVTSEPARFNVFDSSLSEAAVLGFEYGYSLEHPGGLTIWEAQFGDFANGAQVIIDQFIASSGSKWDRTSGITMFLPHGYEGQGAEHSSARIERYLQLCAGNNMFVVNPTTPAQHFHLLRRQAKLPFRRPLIVFTPKSLLRHPDCRSLLDELEKGSFQEVISDDLPPAKCKRIIFCSGKIYYDLLRQRTGRKAAKIALVRIEQLYPLRTDKITAILKEYPEDVEICWAQEEPANSGAWSHIEPQLRKLADRNIRYIGRAAAAATAVGSHRLHNLEQKRLVEEALKL
ncbi:MAG: 2-oxoglutarate dehydrogenase E1 component [Desulfuromonas sp.]|nr:MAG: 2-oxoglutarate dehydrogenase E1 component [Desulfuromonas sp.]